MSGKSVLYLWVVLLGVCKVACNELASGNLAVQDIGLLNQSVDLGSAAAEGELQFFTDALWSENQDLLVNCQEVRKQFDIDADYLLGVEQSFERLVGALNELAVYRRDSYGQLIQTINNYEIALQNEKQNLETAVAQAQNEKDDLQNQIDESRQQAQAYIDALSQSIANVKDAITQLQENLATVVNVDDSRLITVKDMLQSYSVFSDRRASVGVKTREFADQIRIYLGSLDQLISQ
ncbi:hypothetical protein IPH25_04985 [bacterium]|nr:MAG: hypothetical protein IPG37_01990 [bacterium]QQR61793.1 MAG: hypothetical protein IPH25_04985 [bacterium]QQR62627.1 MAG: hypothetical protein IPH67_04395 [bacterium]